MNRKRTERDNREHRFVSDHLSAYIDEQLNERDRLRIEAHLPSCAECRADLRSLRWTQCLLQEAPSVKIPRSFVLREVDVAPRPASGARLRLLTVQWATAAVALLFVLVLGVDLLHLAGPGRTGQRDVAMLMATSQQAVEEVTVEALVAEDEVTALVTDAAPLSEGAETTDASGAGDAAVSPTPEPAAKLVAEPGAEGTPTSAAAAESMRAGVPEATPAPDSEAEVLRAEAPEAAATPAATGEVVGTEVPEESLAPQNVVPPEEPAVPPADGEQDVAETQKAYGTGVEQPGGSRIAWWIAEAILGVALLALVGTLVWLRQRA